MILQTLSRAVREQNYYAVALEFVIVIAGVVIGFQINSWAETREAVARADALTLRLADDLAMERLNVLDTIEYYEVVMRHAEAAAADLRRETVLGGDVGPGGKAGLSDESGLGDEALLVAAYRATQFPGFSRFRSAYDELVSTGALPLVRDDGLRRLSGLLYGSGIYNAHLSDIGENALRTRFRLLIPAPAQRALSDECGDRFTPAPPGGRQSITLDFDCRLSLRPDAVAEAAQRLRGDADFQAALRLRIADLDTMLSNLNDLLVSMESLTAGRLHRASAAG